MICTAMGHWISTKRCSEYMLQPCRICVTVEENVGCLGGRKKFWKVFWLQCGNFLIVKVVPHIGRIIRWRRLACLWAFWWFSCRQGVFRDIPILNVVDDTSLCCPSSAQPLLPTPRRGSTRGSDFWHGPTYARQDGHSVVSAGDADASVEDNGRQLVEAGSCSALAHTPAL